LTHGPSPKEYLNMEQTNLIVINGNELPIEPGETILDVAR
jgi:hypothetical protein